MKYKDFQSAEYFPAKILRTRNALNVGNLDGNVCFRKTRYGRTSGTLDTLCQYTLHEKQISCPLTIDLNISDKFSHQQTFAKEPGEKTFTGWQYGYGLFKLTRSHMGLSD